MGALVVIIIYSLSTLIVGLTMIATGRYVGELRYFSLGVSGIEVFLLLILTIVGFFTVYFIYLLTKNNKKYLTKTKWVINVGKFNKLYLIILISHIIFLLITDVGRVGSTATSSVSFIFSMLNVDVLFGFYYFLCRERKGKYYKINIILYIILKLLQGWTSVLLTIALYEIYLYFKKRNKVTFFDLCKMSVFPISILLIGAKLYQYAYAFKFYIRFNVNTELSYIDGMVNLVNRLTFFPISIGAYEKIDTIKQLYFTESIFFKQIQGLFRPFLPRFIMPNKEFRSLDNNVLQSFWLNLTESTSSSSGFIMHSKTLFSIDWREGVIWGLFTIVLFSLTRRLINSLEQFKGQLEFLYFMLLFKIYYSGSLEAVFGFQYIQLVYWIPIFLLFKVIIFKRGVRT